MKFGLLSQITMETIVQSRENLRDRIRVLNPITNEFIGDVEVDTSEDVQQAVARARAARPAWEALGAKERARLVRQWGDAAWVDREALIQIIRAETGKTRIGAFQEVAAVDNIIEYYFRRSPGLLRPQTRRSAFPLVQRSRIYFRPFGVVGVISPWNYPYLLAFIDIIAALIAGNTIVLKPSEITPLTARLVLSLMQRAGIPRDVVQIVNGSAATGQALVDCADFIMFTGSTAVGRKIAVRCAERLIPCSLELGGKDPFIVLKDADIDRAAAAALLSALENSGQACISTERVYVESPVYEQFLERIQHHARRLIVSAGDGWDVHVGSMTNERELRRAEEHVEDALAKGAQILVGGRRRPDLGPLFYEPTILIDVNHSMRLMQEETFGPLLPVMRITDADEAVRLANDSDYGLSGCIFTGDVHAGERLATRIDSGDITINRPFWTWGTAAAPMGGQKHSGLGRRNGPEGLLRFVAPQAVTIDNTGPLIGQDVVHITPLMLRLVTLRRVLMRYFFFLRP